jgi:hypothetical protein
VSDDHLEDCRETNRLMVKDKIPIGFPNTPLDGGQDGVKALMIEY